MNEMKERKVTENTLKYTTETTAWLIYGLLHARPIRVRKSRNQLYIVCVEEEDLESNLCK